MKTVLYVAAAFLAGCIAAALYLNAGEQPTIETETVYDTIRRFSPAPSDSHLVRYETYRVSIKGTRDEERGAFLAAETAKPGQTLAGGQFWQLKLPSWNKKGPGTRSEGREAELKLRAGQISGPGFLLAEARMPEQKRTEAGRDSADIALPIVQRHYGDSAFEAWVSGPLDPQLDSLRIYAPTTVITRTEWKSPKRWHIGPSVGFGYTGHGFEPFIGISITYSIFDF